MSNMELASILTFLSQDVEEKELNKALLIYHQNKTAFRDRFTSIWECLQAAGIDREILKSVRFKYLKSLEHQSFLGAFPH